MTVPRLRPMTEADLEMVLLWRNHTEVRRYMYTTHEISLEEHRNWFARVSKSPTVNLLIYEHLEQACGYVNMSRGRCNEVADWGFYLAPDAPRGTGRSLGKLTLNHAFDALKLHKVCGQALGFNARSIAFHKKLGFTEEGCLRHQHFDGTVFHDVVCFGLLENEWQIKVKEFSDE